MMSEVILVDEQDIAIGTMDKLRAHELGLLHRAFSIFLFNEWGELLLQQRALHKYHSGGLWTNTCCSHPEPGEELMPAAKRRLSEELGILAFVKYDRSFIYKTEFENGLTEHEYDHILTGRYDGPVQMNEEEVRNYRWISFKELKDWARDEPQHFTVWFLKSYEETFLRYQGR